MLKELADAQGEAAALLRQMSDKSAPTAPPRADVRPGGRVGAQGPRDRNEPGVERRHQPLAGPVARSWFSLYVVIDICSRKIVTWSIDTIESDKVVRRLIRRACAREGIDPDQLTLHSDRGAQTTSTTIADCWRPSA